MRVKPSFQRASYFFEFRCYKEQVLEKQVVLDGEKINYPRTNKLSEIKENVYDFVPVLLWPRTRVRITMMMRLTMRNKFWSLPSHLPRRTGMVENRRAATPLVALVANHLTSTTSIKWTRHHKRLFARWYLPVTLHRTWTSPPEYAWKTRWGPPQICWWLQKIHVDVPDFARVTVGERNMLGDQSTGLVGEVHHQGTGFHMVECANALVRM